MLSFNALVAPTKVLIVPISANAQLAPLVAEVGARLRGAGVHARVDDSSASIGRRYARNDELGTPYGVTIDFASVQNRTMTLRCAPPLLLGPLAHAAHAIFRFLSLARACCVRPIVATPLTHRDPAVAGPPSRFLCFLWRVRLLRYFAVRRGMMLPRRCRERDTMKQRIGPIDEVIAVVTELVNGSLDWDAACERLPEYSGQQDV